MINKYNTFDISKVKLKPLSERINNLNEGFILPLDYNIDNKLCEKGKLSLKETAKYIINANSSKSNVLFMFGGHVIRSGVQRYIFDLLNRGLVQGIAVNGSVAIHDFEIALQYATTESVSKYISEGQFGLWKETGRINDILREGAKDGLGFGESLGREISEGSYPYKELSLFALAWNLRIPITVHLGIGYDIINSHPNCDGAILGESSYRDFLIFTNLVSGLEGGVLASFGSAVMAPEVFLKALSCVRNVGNQEGKSVKHFVTLVCDLLDIPFDIYNEPDKSNVLYYFRPWKTLLSRTVADGGKSFYVQGKHEFTIPLLWKYILENM